MEVFIDTAFLQKLVQKNIQNPQEPIVGEVIEFLSTLSRVQVYINLTSHFELLSNPIYKKLTNMGVNLPLLLPGFEKKLDRPEELGRSSYKLFFTEVEDAEALSKKIGYLVFSSTSVLAHWSRFSKNRTDLEIPIAGEFRNELVQWHFLNRFAHPLRSIIITDRYMLKSRQNVRDNVIPLIKVLLKQSQDFAVEILLIGLFANEGVAFPIGGIYEDLLKVARGKPGIKIHLLDAGKSFHSRGIVTSYWYINPDTSLDFIYGDGLSRQSDGNIYHGFFYRMPKISTVNSFLEKVKEKLQQNTVRVYEPHLQRCRPLEKEEKVFTALNF